MRIREAKKPEAEKIVRELWLPLAREMEQVSEYNELKEDLVLEDSIEHKRNGIREEGEHMFVADDGELLGFISATRKETPPVFKRGDKLKVNELYVKPEARKQGIASKLLEKINEIAGKNDEIDTVELEVDVENTAAKKLYRKNGFEAERNRMVKNT